MHRCTVYPKKYAHGFCFAVLCCGYTLTDVPISIRLTSLALWQSNDCPSASKATLMNMDKYFMWIHYERLHNHNKAKHNKTVCIFLGIYCSNSSNGHHDVIEHLNKNILRYKDKILMRPHWVFIIWYHVFILKQSPSNILRVQKCCFEHSLRTHHMICVIWTCLWATLLSTGYVASQPR